MVIYYNTVQVNNEIKSCLFHSVLFTVKWNENGSAMSKGNTHKTHTPTNQPETHSESLFFAPVWTDGVGLPDNNMKHIQ